MGRWYLLKHRKFPNSTKVLNTKWKPYLLTAKTPKFVQIRKKISSQLKKSIIISLNWDHLHFTAFILTFWPAWIEMTRTLQEELSKAFIIKKPLIRNMHSLDPTLTISVKLVDLLYRQPEIQDFFKALYFKFFLSMSFCIIIRGQLRRGS